MLIYFWAPWCAVCKRMEAEVLAQPSVAAEITANYVAVKIDADHFPATARQYGVTALPTTVIVTPQGQLLVSIQGRIEAADYVARLDQIAAGAEHTGRFMPRCRRAAAPPAAAMPAAPPTARTTAADGPARRQRLPVARALTAAGQPSGNRQSSRRAIVPALATTVMPIFPGSQAAPATPIAQPPSSLAGTANTQPPPTDAAGQYAEQYAPPTAEGCRPAARDFHPRSRQRLRCRPWDSHRP